MPRGRARARRGRATHSLDHLAPPRSRPPARGVAATGAGAVVDLRSVRAGGVSSVDNALRILRSFSYSEPTLGVSELARRLGLGKSTVHRLLQALVRQGFVTRTPDGRYR